MQDEVLTAIEASNAAFVQFKSNINERLRGLEAFEAKATNRPRNGGVGGAGDSRIDTSSPEIKALNLYLRRGDASELKALDITNASEGGYAVPKIIDGMLSELLLLQSPIRRVAGIQQISTSDFHHLVNLRGTGSAWAAELDAVNVSAAPSLADVVPPMGELRAFPLASQQMLEDAQFNAAQWLIKNVADEFGRAESDAFINGNGTAKPKGFLTYTIVATGDASRAFGSLQYFPTGAASTLNATNPLDVLQSAIYALKPGYREGGNACWLLNSNTLAVISTLKDTLGRFLLVPSLAAGRPPTLLGYDCIEAQHMPDIGANAYPIAFGNFKAAYLIVDRIGTTVLQDSLTQKPYVGFYTRKRTGGAVVNSEAIKLVKVATS